VSVYAYRTRFIVAFLSTAVNCPVLAESVSCPSHRNAPRRHVATQLAKKQSTAFDEGLRLCRNRRPKVSHDVGDLRSAGRLGQRPATAQRTKQSTTRRSQGRRSTGLAGIGLLLLALRGRNRPDPVRRVRSHLAASHLSRFTPVSAVPRLSLPRCNRPIWHPTAHWATQAEIDRLDWNECVVGTGMTARDPVQAKVRAFPLEKPEAGSRLCGSNLAPNGVCPYPDEGNDPAFPNIVQVA
jgi:hypothetical protein